MGLAHFPPGCYNGDMKLTARKTQYALTAVTQALASLRAYGDLPPPDAREDVLEARAQLLHALPEASLSREQLAALAYLIDGRDAALMAYFSGASPRQARQLFRETLALLDFSSQAQLLLRLGELRAGGRDGFAGFFEEYGLTSREREVFTLLLTTGGAQKHIAGQLDLSADTVKFHVKNIYRKLGVQSRAELEAKVHRAANR